MSGAVTTAAIAVGATLVAQQIFAPEQKEAPKPPATPAPEPPPPPPAQPQAAQAPDEQARRASQRAAQAGPAGAMGGGGTMLTGAGGVTPGSLSLGKSTLLGQ